LEKSGITLFWIDKGVDSGDIWKQEEFSIDIDDDASIIYEKIKTLSASMLRAGISDLENNVIKRTEQDSSKANYWRKRTPADGAIDWRMSSKRIYDLVRALAKPYAGAHCVNNGTEAKIWKCREIEPPSRIKNIEPGKVVFSGSGRFAVKTGDGIVEIIEHEFKILPRVGDYL
jgi:methionyl-tRNA formyltransferase